MRIKKIGIKILIITIFILLNIRTSSNAISISVSSSSVSVPQGGTVTVRVTGSDAIGNITATSSNNGIATASISDTWIENNSVVVTISGKSVGQTTIKLTGKMANNAGTTEQSINKTITVNVTSNSGGGSSGGSTNNGGGSTNNTNNANCNLKNLGIRPHDFSGFSANKTSYSVNVPNDCTSVEVYAQAAASGAKVSGTGTKTLKEGTNKFNVVVSNGGKTKTYTISVIRATNPDSQEVPNVIEELDEQPVEENPGIGLSKLEIPGYELDKEFATNVYEYIVKADKELTIEELNEIKDQLVLELNLDTVIYEATAEITEDGTRQIVIVVKDEEREYARYTIKFEVENEDEAVAGIIADENPTDSGTGLPTLSLTNRVYILATLLGITLCVSIALAVNSYIQTRKLREYTDDEYYEDEEGSAFDPMNQFYDEFQGANGEEQQPEVSKEAEELIDPTQDFGEITTEIISKSQKLNGYRNLRGQRKPTGGRHF